MYHFSTELTGNLAEVEQKVVEALKQEGFGVLTKIDVQATLKAKLGLDKRPYVILGACNPAYANQAIDTDPEIGLLLPCNVVVRENADASITVSFMDPAAVLALVNNDAITNVAGEVRERLLRVKEAL